ncbi:MAG: hypothetical protein KDK90_08950 [Leptospiraceae bacterium]|nr:hypothetical protein [Leptospiraceae bacterium]
MDLKNIKRAMYLTNVVLSPKNKIFTFGDTQFKYYVLSSLEQYSILRTGDLICSKPTIVTPETLNETFRGFSEDAIDFAENNYSRAISKLRVLGYQFSNNLVKKEMYNQTAEILIDKIIEKQSQTESMSNSTILLAPDDIWTVSLMKIAFEIITKSFPGNVQDLEDRGYFLSQREKEKMEIEFLFSEATENKSYIKELGKKLQEYNLFDEYEDRFFNLTK